jgi:hypothetical protein
MPPNAVFSCEALPGQSFTTSEHRSQRLPYGLAEQRRNGVADLFHNL